MNRKYGYNIIKDMSPNDFTEEYLNQLGQEGWKLVSIQKDNGKWNAIFIKE